MMIQRILKQRLLGLATIAALLALGISCNNTRRTLALEEGWDLLGESKANFVRDKDEIPVLSSNTYTAIRFKVENKDVHLNDLHITFQNGDRLAPVMDDVITAGQTSRIIELGEGKSIRSIDLKYRSTGNVLKGRAGILVFGKRATDRDYRRDDR